MTATYPRFDAHSGDILDIQFNPFDDNMIATCSDDTTVKVWEIPEGEMRQSVGEPYCELAGHQKKVHIIEWHPVAANVILSAGGDNLILIWNVLMGEIMFQVEDLPEQVFCVSWTWNGRYFATSSKDLYIRLYDPRKTDGDKMIQITQDKAHEGKKQMQIKCLKDDRLVSTGFGRQSDRQYALWSISTEPGQPNLSSGCLMDDELDQTSGVLFIVYDPDSSMIYLVGRGDTTIRLFEVKNNNIQYLNSQSYTDPHKGVAVLPKRGVNIKSCEIMRFYRVLPNKNLIEVVNWTVPRKSDMFQADLYPDTAANRPAIEADEWHAGQHADPIMVPIQSLQEGTEKKSKSSESSGPPGASRAAAIAARAHARAQQEADQKYGANSGSGSGKMSRYEREKEAAGMNFSSSSTTNGHHAEESSQGGDMSSSTGGGGRDQSKHVAQLVDEMRKLTLVVKAHEARIRQLEEQLSSANNNNTSQQSSPQDQQQEEDRGVPENSAVKNGLEIFN